MYQCSRSMRFWYGSGSGSVDPYLWQTDPDPLFSSVNFKTPTTTKISTFLLISFWRYNKEVKNSSNLGFFLLFLLYDRRIRIREAQKHRDPTDPDPKHRDVSCTWIGTWGRRRWAADRRDPSGAAQLPGCLPACCTSAHTQPHSNYHKPYTPNI